MIFVGKVLQHAKCPKNQPHGPPAPGWISAVQLEGLLAALIFVLVCAQLIAVSLRKELDISISKGNIFSLP